MDTIKENVHNMSIDNIHFLIYHILFMDESRQY